jgi:radical SAM-linked protein
VRRAWELGAGMDAWMDNLTRAFAAWENAIAESNLTWKYRQVENGEWNVMELKELKVDKLKVERSNLQPSNLQPSNFQPANLYAPLPWDRIDTGIDKNWLIADLQRALEAATVPDCSFDGCSHCGICGVDFGHNVVIPPLPIPKFEGHFKPNSNKVQRLRVWFGKLGDMALVSHLDLVRLYDRAIRRASLPIAYTSGYHPMPRIMIANALPLGATSEGEIVEFELTQAMEVEEFKQRLTSQLPSDIPLYRVEEVDLTTRTATQVLERAEYLLTIRVEGDAVLQWHEWVEHVKEREVIEWQHTTKSGKKYPVNLRDRLFELEVKQPLQAREEEGVGSAVVRYVGSCRNDGTLLRPEHLVYMLEQVTHQEFQLLHSHRQQLILGDEGSS